MMARMRYEDMESVLCAFAFCLAPAQVTSKDDPEAVVGDLCATR